MSLAKAKLSNPIHFFALGFGSGLLPKAPGTWGTVVAIPIYLLLQPFSLVTYATIVLFGVIIGVYLCHVTARDLGVHDHPAIVWDEIIGYLVTMFAAPRGWIWVVLGFILFRLFDIWKPWPIKYCDRVVQGGLGIMLDDILAAIPAWVILHMIWGLS